MITVKLELQLQNDEYHRLVSDIVIDAIRCLLDERFLFSPQKGDTLHMRIPDGHEQVPVVATIDYINTRDATCSQL